jgi:regulator of ribosome biosynthesis
MEDQYEKRQQEKAERVSKNKSQQKRNAEEAAFIHSQKLNSSKGAIDSLNISKEAKKLALEKKLVTSKTSTASIGKFDKKIEGEKAIKIKRDKRKFDPVTSSNSNGDVESQKVKKIAQDVLKKSTRTTDGTVIMEKALSNVAQGNKRRKHK